jgi:outer membrane protein TolC
MRQVPSAAGVERAARDLESIPTRTLPTVRAETAINSAENLDVLTQGVVHFQALTALVSVDYPLLGGQTPALRRDEARANAALYRGRAAADDEEIFRQTLDAFAQLWLAQQRIALTSEAANEAKSVRERANNLLARGEISNVTAASWQERALAAESRRVDLELQRIDAETRLKQLIGDTSEGHLDLVLDIDNAVPKRTVSEASLEEAKRRVAFDEALQLRRPQATVSAFAGIANVPSIVSDNTRTGTFGIYGIRFSLALPMFDTATAMRAAEAKLELEDASRVRASEELAAKRRADALRVAASASQKRIELLTESIAIAGQRRESVARLVSSGVRPEADLIDATSDVAARQSDLLAAKVERWKIWEMMSHEGVAP